MYPCYSNDIEDQAGKPSMRRNMNWRFILLNFGFSLGIVVIAVGIENTVWIGEECIPNDPGGVCSQLAPATRRSFYWSLDQCKQALSAKSKDFVCASGPDPERPEMAIAKSFRKSFTSSTGVLESREVSGFSIIALPLASTIGVITFLLGQVIAIFATQRRRTN